MCLCPFCFSFLSCFARCAGLSLRIETAFSCAANASQTRAAAFLAARGVSAVDGRAAHGGLLLKFQLEPLLAFADGRPPAFREPTGDAGTLVNA